MFRHDSIVCLLSRWMRQICRDSRELIGAGHWFARAQFFLCSRQTLRSYRSYENSGRRTYERREYILRFLSHDSSSFRECENWLSRELCAGAVAWTHTSTAPHVHKDTISRIHMRNRIGWDSALGMQCVQKVGSLSAEPMAKNFMVGDVGCRVCVHIRARMRNIFHK